MAPLDPDSETGLPQSYRRPNVRPRDGGGPANLADILERVLDKGIVIAGDIQINLLEIELLTIKLRLVICSVERAQEMGINWWQTDPRLTTPAGGEVETETVTETVTEPDPRTEELRDRVERLERLLPEGESAAQRDPEDARKA